MKKYLCAFMSVILIYYNISPIAFASGSNDAPAESTPEHMSGTESNTPAAHEGINIFIDDELAFSFITEDLPEGYVPIKPLAEVLGGTYEEYPAGAHIYVNCYDTDISYDLPYIAANGRFIYCPEEVFTDGEDSPALPFDTAARIFGCSVWYTGDDVYFYTDAEPLLPGDEFYDPDDLYWLSRIISAEARGEILDGKISVGNVILNRVRSDMYPDSIYDVIFDSRYGIQFTPAADGSVYDDPTEESVIAAKLVLDGADAAGDCLYFAASYIAASCWAGQNREYFAQIGNHCFFL